MVHWVKPTTLYRKKVVKKGAPLSIARCVMEHRHDKPRKLDYIATFLDGRGAGGWGGCYDIPPFSLLRFEPLARVTLRLKTKKTFH